MQLNLVQSWHQCPRRHRLHSQLHLVQPLSPKQIPGEVDKFFVAAYRTTIGIWRGILPHWCQGFVLMFVQASRRVNILRIPEIGGLSLRISSTLSIRIVTDANLEIPRVQVGVSISSQVLFLSPLLMFSLPLPGSMVDEILSFHSDFHSHFRLVIAHYCNSVVVIQPLPLGWKPCRWSRISRLPW